MHPREQQWLLRRGVQNHVRTLNLGVRTRTRATNLLAHVPKHLLHVLTWQIVPLVMLDATVPLLLLEPRKIHPREQPRPLHWGRQNQL